MIRKLESASEGAGLEPRPKRKRLLLAALVAIFLALGLMTAARASADSWGGICCADGTMVVLKRPGPVDPICRNIS
jgi:hypothetical protein